MASRFSFADLEELDGTTARVLQLPPSTPSEGSTLLAAAGGDWLGEAERRAMVRAVDGHALAVGVLAGLLADRSAAGDLVALHGELVAAARTDARVGGALRFYARLLSEPDRYLLAAVPLFPEPVPAMAVLTAARHETFYGQLTGWTPEMVRIAVQEQLAGLASWHPDGTVSAHPLVRDAFRPLVADATQAAAEALLAEVPQSAVPSLADAYRQMSDDQGRFSELVLPFFGGQSAGKTRLMAAMMLMMALNEAGGDVGVSARLADDETRHRYAALREVFGMAGNTWAAPPGELQRAHSVLIEIGRSKRLLYMFDAAGERFAEVDRTDHLRYLRAARTYLFVLDPMSVPAFWSALTPREEEELDRSLASGMLPELVFNESVQTLIAMRAKVRKSRLAAAISKTDVIARTLPEAGPGWQR